MERFTNKFFLVKFLIVNSAVELEFLWLTLDMIWQHCLCADNCRIFLSPFVDSFKNFYQIAQKDSTWRMVDCNLKTYWKLLVDILQLIQH